MFFKINLNQDQNSKFKRRKYFNVKPLKLTWGDCGIFFSKQERFEFIYYIFVKRFLKKFMKKGVYTFSSKKYWVFLRSNLTLSKKSKNSRMGKGKGSFLRRSFRTRVWSPLIEFKGANPFLIKAFTRFLIFKTRLKYQCIYSLTDFYSPTGRPGRSKYLYVKYNYFK